jgi:Ca2+-binding EF-hand superfamily protein
MIRIWKNLLLGSGLLSAGLLTICTSQAWSADEKKAEEGKSKEAKTLFEQLDKNGDGELAKDEVPEDKQRLVERIMRASDKNEDGKLSLEEFTAGLNKKPELSDDQGPGRGPGRGIGGERADGPRDPEEIFNKIDRDGDGKIKLDDVPEERRERFSKMMEAGDANKDGVLTKEEFVAAAKKMRRDGGDKRPEGNDGPGRDGKRPPEEFAAGEGKGPGDGKGPGGRGPGQGGPGQGGPGGPGGQGGRMMGGPLMRALDADGDGKISKSEIENAAKALAKLDKNGDGELTREELMPPPPQGGQGGPGGPGQGQGGGRFRQGNGQGPNGQGPGPGGDNPQGRRRPAAEEFNGPGPEDFPQGPPPFDNEDRPRPPRDGEDHPRRTPQE